VKIKRVGTIILLTEKCPTKLIFEKIAYLKYSLNRLKINFYYSLTFIIVYCTHYILGIKQLYVYLSFTVLMPIYSRSSDKWPLKWSVYFIAVVRGISHTSGNVCLESTKIVFEMSSLANVSPQTIASCSVVHFSSDTVPWKCLIDSWCQNAVDRWFLPMSRFAV